MKARPNSFPSQFQDQFLQSNPNHSTNNSEARPLQLHCAALRGCRGTRAGLCAVPQCPSAPACPSGQAPAFPFGQRLEQPPSPVPRVPFEVPPATPPASIVTCCAWETFNIPPNTRRCVLCVGVFLTTSRPACPTNEQRHALRDRLLTRTPQSQRNGPRDQGSASPQPQPQPQQPHQGPHLEFPHHLLCLFRKRSPTGIELHSNPGDQAQLSVRRGR